MNQNLGLPPSSLDEVSKRDLISVNITLLDKNHTGQAEIAWKKLQSELSDVGLTSTWEWVGTWLKHYGDLVDYWFVLGTDTRGNAMGITLLTKELHRPLPIPVKAFHVGTNGESYKDQVQMIHNAVLVKSEAKEDFYAALTTAVMKMFNWEEIVFDDYAPNDAQMISAIAQRNKYDFATEIEPTLYMDLDKVRKSGQDLLSHFGFYMRRNIRRSLKVFNDIEVEWVDDANKVPEALEELIQLYEKTWNKLGREGKFASKPFSGFHREVIPLLVADKRAALFIVRSKKFGILGCFYFTVDKGVAYLNQIGLNDFSHLQLEDISPKRLKVGYIVHYLCMEECMKRGINAYNFSTGVYPYKHELTNAQDEVVTVSIRKGIKPSLRNKLIQFYAKLDSNKNASLIIKMVHILVISFQ